MVLFRKHVSAVAHTQDVIIAEASPSSSPPEHAGRRASARGYLHSRDVSLRIVRLLHWFVWFEKEQDWWGWGGASWEEVFLRSQKIGSPGDSKSETGLWVENYPFRTLLRKQSGTWRDQRGGIHRGAKVLLQKLGSHQASSWAVLPAAPAAARADPRRPVWAGTAPSSPPVTVMSHEKPRGSTGPKEGSVLLRAWIC